MSTLKIVEGQVYRVKVGGQILDLTVDAIEEESVGKSIFQPGVHRRAPRKVYCCSNSSGKNFTIRSSSKFLSPVKALTE